MSRIGFLESENCELKFKLTSLSSIPISPVQQFHTPRNSNPRVIRDLDLGEAKQPTPIVIPDESQPEADAEETQSGDWFIVKNKNNKVVKKLWKPNMNNPVGNSAVHKKRNKTQPNGNKKRNQNRNFNRRNNSNRFDNHINRENMSNDHHFYNNQPQVNDLLVNLTNFLMHQTRQPMPIYRNHFC